MVRTKQVNLLFYLFSIAFLNKRLRMETKRIINESDEKLIAIKLSRVLLIEEYVGWLWESRDNSGGIN